MAHHEAWNKETSIKKEEIRIDKYEQSLIEEQKKRRAESKQTIKLINAKIKRQKEYRETQLYQRKQGKFLRDLEEYWKSSVTDITPFKFEKMR